MNEILEFACINEACKAHHERVPVEWTHNTGTFTGRGSHQAKVHGSTRCKACGKRMRDVHDIPALGGKELELQKRVFTINHEKGMSFSSSGMPTAFHKVWRTDWVERDGKRVVLNRELIWVNHDVVSSRKHMVQS